jgi:hypothetical protein
LQQTRRLYAERQSEAWLELGRGIAPLALVNMDLFKDDDSDILGLSYM